MERWLNPQRLEDLVGHPYVGSFGCFTVVRKALTLLGKPLPDYADGLAEEEKLSRVYEALARHAERVEVPQRGDVVVLKALGSPTHLGVMVDEKEMLHCIGGANAVLERVNSARWRGRVVGYWRV